MQNVYNNQKYKNTNSEASQSFKNGDGCSLPSRGMKSTFFEGPMISCSEESLPNLGVKRRFVPENFVKL